MSRARKVLVFGGIALAALGMLYGLYYAVFVEHQMLDRMGGSLASVFVEAADRQWEESEGALLTYGETKHDYVRQVDVHSHWIGLAMLMIVLGVAFDEVRFTERTRFWIAVALLLGSVMFPLGVVLQTTHAVMFASALAVAGSALVTIALAAAAIGFARQRIATEY